MPETIVISNSVFIVLSLELLFSLALPIAAIVVWKKKADVSLRPCVLGAVAFFVFAVVLEQIIHFLVLGLNGTVSDFILSRPWLYAVYGGFMAGFIEESARFLVFKTMMRDNVGRENAVSYGARPRRPRVLQRPRHDDDLQPHARRDVQFHRRGEFIAQYAPGAGRRRFPRPLRASTRSTPQRRRSPALSAPARWRCRWSFPSSCSARCT